MGWWFGRIMTFEVFGDENGSTIGEILADCSEGFVAGNDVQQIAGYAAYGQSIKAAIAPLIDCFDVGLFDDGRRLVSPETADPVLLDDDALGTSADNQSASRVQREQEPASSLPSALRLGYYDPALDYQAGEARATVSDKRGTEDRTELAAALDSGAAKSLAQRIIAKAWADRDKLTLRLPPRFLALQPGTRLRLQDSAQDWRVEQVTIDAFVAVAELRPVWTAAATVATVAAQAGRIIAADDSIAADVTLALFDMPDVLEQGNAAPTLMLAASSPSAGWKVLNAEVATDQLTTQTTLATRKALLGRAATALPDGDPYLINDIGSLEIELVDTDQWLVSCDEDALIGASNLAMLGAEAIQFGRADALGEGRFRLSRLMRGRAGTEWAMGSHEAGEPFVLIERDSLRPVTFPIWTLGANVSATVWNLSGSFSKTAGMMTGESLRPLSPVALRGERDAAGNLVVTWVRRSRKGFAWLDGVDAPLGETLEKYRVTIAGADGALELETSVPTAQVPASQLATIGAGELRIEVRQVGDSSVSRPASCTITISGDTE